MPDPSGRTYRRVVYSRVPAADRFAFTPVDASPWAEHLPNPSDQSINQLAFISYIVVYRPFQELTSYSCLVQVSSNFLFDHLLSV